MNESQPRNAVIFVIDYLGANRLGPYGNTCYETHNFSRLAARSILFDQAMTPSTDLELAYHGLWKAGNARNVNLIEQISRSGIGTSLLTDEPFLENIKAADSFDRVLPVPFEDTNRVAESVEETELARFFAHATEFLNNPESGHLYWMHSRGLGGAWDAPNELRHRLADSDDPEPPAFFEPPACWFDPGADDPDDLLGYQQVSAAQVVLIDDFLGVILDSMETHPVWKSTLFCLISTRGFPLGEHNQVGLPMNETNEPVPGQDLTLDPFGPGRRLPLYNESIHVPMMICLPGQTAPEVSPGFRNGSLIQTDSISSWLSDWFADSDEPFRQCWESLSRAIPDKRHELTISIAGEAQAIQTHAWKLIRSGTNCELYVKPDDLWEVNDISQRCPQIVDQLGKVLDQFQGVQLMEKRFELSEELSIRLG